MRRRVSLLPVPRVLQTQVSTAFTMWSRVDRFDKRAFSDRYLDRSLRELGQNVDLGTTAMDQGRPPGVDPGNQSMADSLIFVLPGVTGSH
jgi:hypothetical protein